MGLVVFAFFSIFLLIATGGILIFYRAGMMQRLSAAISPATEDQGFLSWLKINRARSSLKAAIQPFDKVLPKSQQEVSVIQQRLIRAGFREDAHVRIFYGAKVLVPFFLCILAAASGLSHYSPFFVYTLALALGYLAPDFWLGRRITARQANIRLGLPDFLDMMVVCIEAGLSLDQSLARGVEELRPSHPEISDEMGLVMLEQRAGRVRSDAWKHLAERVDLDVVRAFVSGIVQADQFGTSISKTLRVYSDTLRVQRRQSVEELAAKTAVKLVFPLVLFIFPSLFVVALGPAIIAISESFQKYLSK
jgi:tight adherence protein C